MRFTAMKIKETFHGIGTQLRNEFEGSSRLFERGTVCSVVIYNNGRDL